MPEKNKQTQQVSFSTIRDEWLSKKPPINMHLWEELQYLRNRPAKKGKQAKRMRMDRPVASFQKTDRLRNGIGTEITLIMRSRACSWAHSKSGGCTMCGYWNDRADITISAENYWHQFQHVITQFKDILTSSDPKQPVIIFKIFTSGSFTDSNEIPSEIQERILSTLASYGKVKEIVVESRPEYLTAPLLNKYRSILKDTYLEFGIGLESANDFIRTNIINKGFSRRIFEEKIALVQKYNFGIKAYILFKPPFLNEFTAINDTLNTIQYCIGKKVNTISINPTNIQNNTLCDELNKKKQFRPPWLYSLLWLIKNAIKTKDLEQTRVLCDPSAKGKDRGVHNCIPKDPSNNLCLDILEKFVMNQDISVIPEIFSESFSGQCFEEYLWDLYYSDT